MRTLLTILVGLAMLGTLGVLFAGLFGFVSGRNSPAQSNKLMQYRVLLQGIAILLFGLLLYLQKS
jgi:uncharacterized YccA/Bax inhibitor family protein